MSKISLVAESPKANTALGLIILNCCGKYFLQLLFHLFKYFLSLGKHLTASKKYVSSIVKFIISNSFCRTTPDGNNL